jgi:hypothetical protein
MGDSNGLTLTLLTSLPLATALQQTRLARRAGRRGAGGEAAGIHGGLWLGCRVQGAGCGVIPCCKIHSRR